MLSRTRGAVLIALCSVASALWGLRIDLALGFDGVTVPGTWAPLVITADEAVDGGRIEVLRIGSEGNEVSLEAFPFAGGGELEIPVFVDQGSGAEPLMVRITAGGEILFERRLNVLGKSFPGHVVLTVAQPRTVRAALEGMLLPDESIRISETSYIQLPVSALAYDGVSAVVLRDGGPVLSPAQTSALGNWLETGGVLVITDRRGGTSVWSQFSGFPKGLADADGRILSDPDVLRELTGLKPYERGGRLRSDSLFPSRWLDTIDRGDYELYLPLGVALLTWMILFRLAAGSGGVRLRRDGSAVRGVRLVLVLICSGAATVAALAGGPLLNGNWQRGTDTRVRAVLLGETVFTDLYVATRDAVVFPPVTEPWSVGLAYGADEMGGLYPASGRRPEWNHGTAGSVLNLRAAGDRSMRLNAFLDRDLIFPEDPEAGRGQMALAVREGQGLTWREWSGGEWVQTEIIPAWVDALWADILLARGGSEAWMFGISPAETLDFRVQDVALSTIQWAQPVTSDYGLGGRSADSRFLAVSMAPSDGAGGAK